MLANVLAAAVVQFAFGTATWTTPLSELLRGFLVSLLFALCIGSALGVLMPRVSPHIFGRFRFPLNWVAATALMAVVAVAGSAAAIGLLIGAGQVAAADFFNWMAGSVRISLAITLAIGLVITGYELMRAQLAQATAEAQLASLEARVQPHFLFNTLNSIAALIPDDPRGAERMTGQLASLLRSSLDQDALIVPLEDELKTIRDYLAIEQVRFGERLRYAIDVDEGVLEAAVPRLALQTLVENAVKYAVTPRRDGAQVVIRAGFAGARVRVQVEDDGAGFDPGAATSGHGLALLRARLGLLYGDRAELDVDSAPGRTVVTLSVPAEGDSASNRPRPARPAPCGPSRS